MTLTIIITASVGSGSSGSSSGSSGGNYATSYTITLNKQGGYGGSSSVKAYYGDEMPYATKPSKSGYTFEGYFTSTNGKGTKYYNSDMNSVRDWDCKYDDTLYAYWVEIFNKYGLDPETNMQLMGQAARMAEAEMFLLKIYVHTDENGENGIVFEAPLLISSAEELAKYFLPCLQIVHGGIDSHRKHFDELSKECVVPEQEQENSEKVTKILS